MKVIVNLLKFKFIVEHLIIKSVKISQESYKSNNFLKYLNVHEISVAKYIIVSNALQIFQKTIIFYYFKNNSFTQIVKR